MFYVIISSVWQIEYIIIKVLNTLRDSVICVRDEILLTLLTV